MNFIYGRNPLARKRKDDPLFQKKKQAYLSLIRNHLPGTEKRKELLIYLSNCYLKTLEILSEDQESLSLREQKNKVIEESTDKENIFFLFFFFPNRELEKERKVFFSEIEKAFSTEQTEHEINLYNKFLQCIYKKNCILSEQDKIASTYSFYDSHRRDVDSKKLEEGKPTYFLEDNDHSIKIIFEKTVKIPKELYDKIHQVYSFYFSVLELQSLAPYQIQIRITDKEKCYFDQTWNPKAIRKQIACPIEANQTSMTLSFIFTLITKTGKKEISFHQWFE